MVGRFDCNRNVMLKLIYCQKDCPAAYKCDVTRIAVVMATEAAAVRGKLAGD